MAENQGDIYVRKDVFDARMDRLEMLLEKTTVEIKAYVDKSMTEMKTYVDKSMTEIKAENAQFRNEIRAEIGGLRTEVGGLRTEVGGLRTEIGGLRTEIVEVRNDIRVLTARIDSMENVLYWGLGLFGIILALAALLPSILEAVKRLFKPSLTLEDVERIVNTAIANHLSGGKIE